MDLKNYYDELNLPLQLPENIDDLNKEQLSHNFADQLIKDIITASKQKEDSKIK